MSYSVKNDSQMDPEQFKKLKEQNMVWACDQCGDEFAYNVAPTIERRKQSGKISRTCKNCAGLTQR